MDLFLLFILGLTSVLLLEYSKNKSGFNIVKYTLNIGYTQNTKYCQSHPPTHTKKTFLDPDKPWVIYAH